MAGCPFTRKPELCARRQAFATPAPSDCRVCDFFGRKAVADVTDPPSHVTKPPLPETPRSKPEPIPPKKEEVPQVRTDKEKILVRVQREKVVGKSKLMQYDRISSESIGREAEILQQEGKIKVWPGKQKGSIILTLPDAPDPLPDRKAKGEAPTPSNDATVPSKPPRRVNRKSTPLPIKSRAKTERPVPAPRKPGSNGNAIGFAIAELEARRTVALDQVAKIDAVLDSLRVLE